MSLSERIYRVLIKTYPVAFRRRYEEPMVQLFRDRLRDAKSAKAVVRFWCGILADLAKTVPARHAERLPRRCGHFAPAQLACFFARRYAERLPLRHGPRWGTSVMKCLFFSRYEAAAFGCREISVQHLLLGMLRQDQGCVGRVLTPPQINAIQTAIERKELRPRDVPRNVDLPLSLQAKDAVTEAARAARLGGDAELLPRHLITGILKQKSTLAAQLVREYGVFE